MRLSIGLGLVLSLVVMGCDGSSSGAAPATTGSAGATAKPTGAASTTAATSTATAAPKPAEPASAAASFPATDIPAKDFAGLTIGVPPGGKVDKSGDDRASLDTADYKLILKKAGPKDDLAEMKTVIQKLPGFKSIVVDKPDGLVVEFEEKGKPQFVLTRVVKVGDMTLLCDSAATKPPTDKAKGQEAFDVCGTIKKK